MSYPGLGGPTAEHLMTLCLHFPEVRRVLDKIENRGGNPDDMVPTSLMFSPPESLPEESQMALRRRIMSPQLSEMRVGAADCPVGAKYRHRGARNRQLCKLENAANVKRSD